MPLVARTVLSAVQNEATKARSSDLPDYLINVTLEQY